MPGCPAHPDWIIGTLWALRASRLAEADLDRFNRPRAFYGKLAHHACPRNEYYEFKASAAAYSQQGCLFENLGCKGTLCESDCNERLWLARTGSCTRGGFPCLSCTSPVFPDRFVPFFETAKIGGIPTSLPLDVPKAWYVGISGLSKLACPERLQAERRLVQAGLARAKRSRPTMVTKTITFSPFSRLEGDLQVKVDIEDGRIVRAPRLGHSLPGFESMLRGRRPPGCHRHHLPRLRAVRPGPLGGRGGRHPGGDRGRDAAERLTWPINVMLAIETVLSHLTHFYLSFAPDLAEPPCDDETARRFLPPAGRSFSRALRAREEILGVLGLLAGKWPNTLAIQPGGTTRPVDASEIRRATGSWTSSRSSSASRSSGASWTGGWPCGAPRTWIAGWGRAPTQAATWASSSRSPCGAGWTRSARWPARFLSSGGWPDPAGQDADEAGLL